MLLALINVQDNRGLGRIVLSFWPPIRQLRLEDDFGRCTPYPPGKMIAEAKERVDSSRSGWGLRTNSEAGGGGG